MEKLRILYLEDDPNDYELVLREIKKLNIPFDSIRVSTKSEFFSAIESFQPNLILSDYCLPLYTGLEALEDCKKQQITIPFIIVSGKVNQETALECLRLGADDYVFKDHLSSIGNAIRNIVRIYQEESSKLKAIASLVESEERYRSVFLHSKTLMMIFDPLSNQIIDANLAAIRFYGYSLETLQQMKLSDIFCLPLTKSFISDLLDIQTCVEVEHKISDGSSKIMESCGSYIRIDNKSMALLVSVDVTKKIQTERELVINQHRLDEIMDFSPHGKAIFNNQGNLIYCNSSFKDIFHIPSQIEPKAFNLFDCHFLTKENQDELIDHQVVDFELTATSDFLDHMFPVSHKALDLVQVKIIISSIPINTLDQEKEYLMQVTDISDLKRLCKMKEEFINHFSHEMRTPLTSIRESILILKNHYSENLTKDQTTLLATAQRNINRLENLVFTILDFQKMEKESQELTCHFYQLNDLLLQVCNNLESRFQARFLKANFEFDPSLPTILLDKDKIMQVLYSLLNHMLNLMKNGSITISTRTDKQHGIIELADTQLRTHEEDSSCLENPFFSTPSQLNHKDLSLDFGLTLAHKIMEAHHGKLTISSKNIFSIHLPLMVHDFHPRDNRLNKEESN